MGCLGSKEQSGALTKREEIVPVNRAAELPNTATPARGAPLEQPPPAMPSTEEQAAKRAAQLKELPEHLRLGMTLPGMRALFSELPSDKLERVNAHVEKVNAERVKKGKPTYPKNETFNGYCYQYWITQWAKEAKEGQPDGDGLAVCERLRKQGSPHVGEATVFVSWFLATPIETLLDALANFLKEKGLREEDTFFWVCDYVIRQTNVDPDLALLGECVGAVGHTVLLMEPWHAPAPLERAYCITEVYHTQKSGAQFDVVMSSAQRDAFETALVDDFDSIETSLSKVDVRNAKCLKPEETTRILDELERDVGFIACNTLVIGLLREALVAQARAALARLPEAERGTSALINQLGVLLQRMGKLEEARPLFEEAVQARRATLGDRHPSTLISISNMATLLRHGQAGRGAAAVRGGAAGAQGDAGRPPPGHADLDQQHGPAAAGHGQAGRGAAAVRGGRCRRAGRRTVACRQSLSTMARRASPGPWWSTEKAGRALASLAKAEALGSIGYKSTVDVDDGSTGGSRLEAVSRPRTAGCSETSDRASQS